MADSHPEGNAPTAATTEEARTTFEPEKPSETKAPVQQMDETPKGQLPQVKTLLSRSIDDDPVARAAMGNMSPGERVNELCRTELGAQISHESPKFRDASLPSYSLTNQTVVDVRRGVFNSGGNWYGIQYRCEVNAGATKILSFAFRIGGLIPRSQYAKYKIRD